MTKVFGLFFLVLSSMKNNNDQMLRVHKIFWHSSGTFNSIFLRPKRLLETRRFEKKGNLPWKRKIWPIFPPYTACEKPHGTIYKGPQANLAKTVEPIKVFFKT